MLYHFVCPGKYKKVVFSKEIDFTLKKIGVEISKRYDVIFIKIGTDKDDVHFLILSVRFSKDIQRLN